MKSFERGKEMYCAKYEHEETLLMDLERETSKLYLDGR